MSDKKKVLYVDDEPINLLIFEVNFKKDFEVITAANGSAALDLLTENSDIKIVVTDLNMPLMNGLELINKSKQIHEGLTYYLLTGYEITPQIQQALDQGIIVKYFPKPLNCEYISSSIKGNIAGNAAS